MRLRRKYTLAVGTLAAIIISLGAVYAAKPGNCPPIKDYRLDRSHSIGVVYGAWLERVDSAVADYKAGEIAYIMPTGNSWEIDNMKRHAIEAGVPEGRIIVPVRNSRNTRGNVTAVRETIVQKGLPNDLRHYSSDEHLPRIFKNFESGADPEGNDGYRPVDDGYANKIFGIPDTREWAACIRDRF